MATPLNSSVELNQALNKLQQLVSAIPAEALSIDTTKPYNISGQTLRDLTAVFKEITIGMPVMARARAHVNREAFSSIPKGVSPQDVLNSEFSVATVEVSGLQESA